jgi:hypothetical protein
MNEMGKAIRKSDGKRPHARYGHRWILKETGCEYGVYVYLAQNKV